MSQKPKCADKLPEYVNKCVEVCWLMNTQRPPLILAEPLQVGQKIDTFQYKEFTKHGDTVSFVVWLPLLIEKDGAVLTKGVVQPVPKVVTKVPKSKPKGAWTSDKVKSRSRQETQEEKTQRLLNDNDGTSYTKRHDSSGEHSYATRTHEREKYESDLTGHRQKFDEHVSRGQTDPQVDDFFQDPHYRNRTTNISSSGISPSSISHPYSQNFTTSTYGDRFPNTRVSDRPSSAYREQHKDRPSSTYSEQHKDRSDYLNQRSVKTGSSHTVGDRSSVLNINPSNAEIFEAGTGHKYALYGGKLYAQDNYSGSWRFASGFNSDSQA